jgi:hypothetical protein
MDTFQPLINLLVLLTVLSIAVGFALLVKANLFEVLSRVDAPWDNAGLGQV